MFRLLILLLVLCAAMCVQGCPNIIPRSRWGSKYSCDKKVTSPVPWAIIHHTVGNTCNSIASCSAEVRSIQAQHKRKGWCDIGYNFLIGNDGNVYEGQGWTKHGSHAAPYNHKSVGIAFMGNYMTHAPSPAALQAAQKLIACGVSKNYISKKYALKGHRDVNPTACPGNKLHSIIKTWSRFTPGTS